MKPSLRALLAKDRETTHDRALRGCLGDGYLYRHNLVYRNVRDVTIALGYRYTVDDFCGYAELKLASLGDLLEGRRIIYANNRAAVEKIERKRPGVFSLWDLLGIGLVRNYVLHESAHAIADAVLGGNLRGQGWTPNRRKRILGILLEESFANAVETIANQRVQSRWHRIFFGLGSYIVEKESGHRLLGRGMEELGFRDTFKILFFSYLHSNFLYKSLSREELARSTAISGIVPPKGARGRRVLGRLFEVGLALNLRFRMTTAQFHLNYVGIPGDIFELLSFDFLRELEKAVDLLSGLDRLTDIAEKGRESGFASALPTARPVPALKPRRVTWNHLSS